MSGIDYTISSSDPPVEWPLGNVRGPLDGNATWTSLFGIRDQQPDAMSEVLPADVAHQELARNDLGGAEAPHTHDEDFFAWPHHQAARLRNIPADEAAALGLDNTHLAEEIEDLGISELRGLTSQIQRAAMHLLKWKYQKSARSTSWKATIIDACYQIESYFESASLQNKITEADMAYIFRKAYQLALVETGLPQSAIPMGIIFTLVQIKDHDFFPEPD